MNVFPGIAIVCLSTCEVCMCISSTNRPELRGSECTSAFPSSLARSYSTPLARISPCTGLPLSNRFSPVNSCHLQW
jgi:hypothetical protein